MTPADEPEAAGPVPFVRLLSMAVALGLEELHEELARAGHPALRPAHGFALNAISAGVDTASGLAPRLGMTKQGAAKVVSTLIDEGYVEPGRALDARRKPLVLTARGRAAVETSVAIQGRIEQRWAQTVGAAAMQTARDALQAAVLAENDGVLPAARPSW